jgi:iron complex transport system permease protein
VTVATQARGATRAYAPTGSRLALPIAVATLLVLVVAAIALGRYSLGIGQVLEVLRRGPSAAGDDATAAAIVWQIRLPRIGVAALVGAALAAAGAAFQQLFRNPLVAPDTLGVSAGAALGAVVAIVLGATFVAIQVAAFAGGMITVLVVMLVASRLRAFDPIVTLILTGVVIASLLGAGIAFTKFVADPYNQLPAITFWLMGSFASSTYRELVAVAAPVVLCLVVLAVLAWRINVLALPDDEARALGLDTQRTRAVVIAAATLSTSACVAVSGIIGWVGLIVPHMARLIVGPDFSRLLPLSAVMGAAFMLAIDTAARVVLALELPPGILTAVLGTPLFLVLLARTRREW